MDLWKRGSRGVAGGEGREGRREEAVVRMYYIRKEKVFKIYIILYIFIYKQKAIPECL